jgi:magnesium-transporting ATPase (P-type)
VELRFPETKQLETTSSAYMQKQLEFDEKSKDFQKQSEAYSRNVSIIALLASIVMLVLSLTMFKQITIIADGLLLGGVLTLAYSVIRGFGSNDDMVRFMVVSASLIVALTLGYIKFVKNFEKMSKTKRK